LLTFSQGIALPYAQVGAMAAIPRRPTAAAGRLHAEYGAAVLTQVYGLFADGTPLPMVVIVMQRDPGLAAGALLFFYRRDTRIK
jgi:hypothetical protein